MYARHPNVANHYEEWVSKVPEPITPARFSACRRDQAAPRSQLTGGHCSRARLASKCPARRHEVSSTTWSWLRLELAA
jgi:hypothetical protein